MKTIPVIQLGIGNVGLQLVRKVMNFNQTNSDYFIRYIGIADSRYLTFRPEGMNRELPGILRHKGIRSVESSIVHASSGGLYHILELLKGEKTDCLCIVDATASEDISGFLRRCVIRGFNLVLANKKPLTGKMADFHMLNRARLGCRATVGAGLPVIPEIRKILSDSESICKLEGCFSGTMGILCSALEKGEPFSAIVEEVKRKGYTEPDPRDDLSGMDIARKILILARFCGYNIELIDVTVDSLYPGTMEALPLEEFMANLKNLDAGYKIMFDQARKKNATLRFAASLEKGKCRAGMKEVMVKSVIGRLKGPEKAVIITTGKRKKESLVIHGSGAGAESAAKDMLEDILEVSDCNW
ncbi:MAG: hypothetical protein JSV24_06255 [Bacteroidales bacterium]|nr:MAG: hypothetical protein JSV24_06255 [Bacteroidales bacterium]